MHKGKKTVMLDENNVNGAIACKAWDIILSRCCAPLCLEDVARECYVSRWHLSRLISKGTGMNFYGLLGYARVQRSKPLLRGTTLPIGSIAQMLGFSGAAHFARTFKKHEGIPAGDYRSRAAYGGANTEKGGN